MVLPVIKSLSPIIFPQYEHILDVFLGFTFTQYLPALSALYIVDNHNFIAYEDLNIENMLKNHKLAKSIADASWGELIINTMYKAESAGKYCVKVNPRNTSKMCSYCGSIIEEQTLDDREYHCSNCWLWIV